MKRGIAKRLGAVFTALWFGLITLGPETLHACPAHGDAPAAAATQSADPHAHHRAPAGSDESAPAEHECSCIGKCAAYGATVAVPVQPSVSVAVAIVAIAVATPVATERPVSATPHALPFANGPPRA